MISSLIQLGARFIVDPSFCRFDKINAAASPLQAFGVEVSFSPLDGELDVRLFTKLGEFDNETSFSDLKDEGDIIQVEWTMGAQQPDNMTVVTPDLYHMFSSISKDSNEIGIVDTFLDDIWQNSAMKMKNNI